MSSKRKLISTLLCVGALTAGLFVSGCGSEKAADTVSSAVSSATDTKSDEKVSKAFLMKLLMLQISSTVTTQLGANNMLKILLN